MIIPDVNLLLYAVDSRSPFQEKAKAWWQACLSGTESVGLPAVVVFGFVRVSTNARAFERPLTIAEAASHVRVWFAQPAVQALDTGLGHIEQVLKLLESIGTGGNLVTDAQLAAIAIEYNAVLHTSDADFVRFQGLRWHNPITGVSSKHLGKGDPG